MAVIPRPRMLRLTAADRRAGLIQAALDCIAAGGIRAFTVDRICAQAAVSRGLITHHFGSMNALLAAAYSHIYEASAPAETSILALIDHLVSPALFNRQSLNIWLTLWAEISNNAELRAEHRTQYRAYHAMVTAAISAAAPTLSTAPDLAQTLICLVDGLGLQHCIDPDAMPAATARAACLALLVPHTGPLT